jgi:hypothetical protein
MSKSDTVILPSQVMKSQAEVSELAVLSEALAVAQHIADDTPDTNQHQKELRMQKTFRSRRFQ